MMASVSAMTCSSSTTSTFGLRREFSAITEFLQRKKPNFDYSQAEWSAGRRNGQAHPGDGRNARKQRCRTAALGSSEEQPTRKQSSRVLGREEEEDHATSVSVPCRGGAARRAGCGPKHIAESEYAESKLSADAGLAGAGDAADGARPAGASGAGAEPEFSADAGHAAAAAGPAAGAGPACGSDRFGAAGAAGHGNPRHARQEALEHNIRGGRAVHRDGGRTRARGRRVGRDSGGLQD